MTSSFDPEGREAAVLASPPGFSGGAVLEIGAGDGRLTWKYAAHVAAVFGLDPDFESLAFLVEDRPAHLGRAVHPVCAESERLPFPSERFDAAVLSWSL